MALTLEQRIARTTEKINGNEAAVPLAGETPRPDAAASRETPPGKPKRRRKTIDQQIAEAEQRLKKLKRQAQNEERKARTHRLVTSAATIEAVVRQSGMAGFEIDNETASEMARLWLASRKKRINGCYMEDAFEHLS